MKYKSITTPSISHNAANMITELIYLNKGEKPLPYPWRSLGIKDFWGSTVAAISRMMKVHGLTEDQIAFYVYKCQPREIVPAEFAKMAVVAKKLFQKFELSALVEIYRRSVVGSHDGVIAAHKEPTSKPKSLFAFLQELENGKEKV